MSQFCFLVSVVIVRMQILAGCLERLVPQVVSHVAKIQRAVRHSGTGSVSEPMRGGSSQLIGTGSVLIASLAEFV